MNRLLQTALWTVGLLALLLGSAQAAPLKVGVVNAARLLSEAPQADAASRQLEKEFAPRERELVEVQQEAREMEERLLRDGAIMSETERRKLERDLMSRQREVKRMQQLFREDLNLRRNEELGKLQQRINDAIQSLAKREKYDLILSDGVVFASEQVDVTNQILRLLKNDGR